MILATIGIVYVLGIFGTWGILGKDAGWHGLTVAFTWPISLPLIGMLYIITHI